MYSLKDTWGFPCEFPHSEISGSQAICAYPKLIAAYHVLHRLPMPRHSPCALYILTITQNVINFALLRRFRHCGAHIGELCSAPSFLGSLYCSFLTFFGRIIFDDSPVNSLLFSNFVHYELTVDVASDNMRVFLSAASQSLHV
jgi:hypothetical protein